MLGSFKEFTSASFTEEHHVIHSGLTSFLQTACGEQQQGVVRGASRHLRERRARANARARRGARRAVRALRARDWRRSKAIDVPHQSRHSLLEGQIAVQDERWLLVSSSFGNSARRE